MTDISDTSRAHIVHLLEEQKYDEVLPILSDLREKNPSDRESRMYHLLVVRILVLRWNLSRTVTRPAIDSSTMAKRTIKRLASVVLVSASTKLIQSLGQIYRAAETALGKRRIKRVVIAAAVWFSSHTAGVIYGRRQQCSDSSAIEHIKFHRCFASNDLSFG